MRTAESPHDGNAMSFTRTKTCFCLLTLLAYLGLAGCSAKFLGGTALGAVGVGGGYEYKAKQEMDRIKKELDEGKMSKEEYEIRKDQIKRMSVLQ